MGATHLQTGTKCRSRSRAGELCNGTLSDRARHTRPQAVSPYMCNVQNRRSVRLLKAGLGRKRKYRVAAKACGVSF